MNIDKETIPNYINIVMDDSPKFLKQLREQSEADCQNEDGLKRLSLTIDNGSFNMEEYYFDSSESELMISGEIESSAGKTWVSISIPLSDTVLIDILEHSVKKLNKLDIQTMKQLANTCIDRVPGMNTSVFQKLKK